MKKAVLILISALLFAGCSHSVTPASNSSEENSNTAAVESLVQVQAEPELVKEGENEMAEKLEMTIDAFGNETDYFLTKSGKKVAFHAIIHGSVWFEYDGFEFYVDPVSKLDNKETDFSQYPKADYLLITHEHFDHLDEDAVAKLEKEGTVIVTNENSASKLGRGEVMRNGDVKTLRDDVKIEAVPAYNTTRGHEKFHPKGRDNGFVVTLDGLRVYISGDTEDIAEMEQLKDIDIAFMSVNQPYTMMPVQLKHAVEMVKPKVLFPYHYSDTRMADIKLTTKDSSVDMRIRRYQ